MGQGVSGLGSTKSMLSGMKRLRWDVWLEASGVPTDHCGVAMGVLEQRIDSAGADKGMSRASYFARAGRLWLPELIRCPSCGAGVRFLMQSLRVIGVRGSKTTLTGDRYRWSLSVVRRKTALESP